MKERLISLCLVVLAVLALSMGASSAGFAAEKYDIDFGHSRIEFTVRHFGVSRVRGEFRAYESELMFDEADPTGSSVELRIRTASVDTDDGQRDEHLRSDDFFNSEAFPHMVFRSTGITGGEGEYAVTGELTIRETTREIEIPVSLAGPLRDPLGMMRMGIEGGVTIDRQDYGMKFSRTMDNGGLLVGNDVKIYFSLEATRPADGADEASN
jgi:polyisoprenoid-binding protein YceI